MNAHPSSLSDRELLELAAKAAGIETNGPASVSGLLVRLPYEGKTPAYGTWNPLTDDGDAMRLAVKLGLDVCQDTDSGFVEVRTPDTDWLYQSYGDDPLAATRRAIVRAASSIIPRAK